VIEVGAGIHLSVEDVRALLEVLESACRVARPDARAEHVITQLRRIVRKTDSPVSRDLRCRADGYDTAHHRLYDVVDSAEAASLLSISQAGVRDLRRRGQLPGHRAGGRWLYPVATIIERAERKAAARRNR
jgi:hypothetical protein